MEVKSALKIIPNTQNWSYGLVANFLFEVCNFPDVSFNDTSLVDFIKCHENPERLLYDCYFVIFDLDIVNYLTQTDRTKVGGALK